jgi:hypothetical protein
VLSLWELFLLFLLLLLLSFCRPVIAFIVVVTVGFAGGDVLVDVSGRCDGKGGSGGWLGGVRLCLSAGAACT